MLNSICRRGICLPFSKGDRHQLCRVSGAAPRQGGLCSAAGWRKVSDLPERLGYNSIQSFRRAFKRVMGVSPSEYRG
ncbi:MAG: helix-turn-helix domain-containing protein [Gemmiger formicilis]